jgi:outer membrane protein assembly factor BamB
MEYNHGNVSIYKINAANGEIVWETTYSGVHYDKNVSGGALSSPLLGKSGTELEGKIIFHIAKTPGAYQGITVALDTTTGEALWEKTSSYCWSSPVAIYEEDGNAYIVLCDSAGNVHLLDAKTGETLQKLGVGANVEASPAVFGNTLVVGTRGQKVFGIKIS